MITTRHFLAEADRAWREKLVSGYSNMAEREDVTLLLNSVAEGGRAALDKLLPLVYEELRQLAEGYLTLQRKVV